MSMKPLTPRQIGDLRIIEYIDLRGDKKGAVGQIWLNGKIEKCQFDDVVDFMQMVETLLLKHSGKTLNAKFRPVITNRSACRFDKLIAGDASLYDGYDAPMDAAAAYYLRIEIDGNRWDNWFTRLDELAKLLYVIIKEAQEDEYRPDPAVSVYA